MANIFGSATSLKDTPSIENLEQFKSTFPNFKVVENNKSYVAANDAKEAFSEATDESMSNMLNSLNKGLLKENEIPKSMKLNLVDQFGLIAESNNYDPDTQDIQLAFQYNSNTHKLINQFYSISQDDSMNNRLTDDFLEDHELSHSKNYHQQDGFIKIHDPVSGLTENEKKAILSNDTFKSTIDENFADSYGAILLLKNNDFSPQSINVVKKIRDIREKMSHEHPDMISTTHYDPHSSAYSLNNILDNINSIKATNDPEKLKDIAVQCATHGSLLGIQHYKKEQDFSLEYALNTNYSAFYKNHLFNEINKDRKNFKPMDIDWSAISEEDKNKIQTYVAKNKDKSNSLNRSLNMNNMDMKTVTETAEAMKGLGMNLDVSQVAFILQSASNMKTFDTPEARANQLKEILTGDNKSKNENDYATKLELFESVDKKIDNLPNTKFTVSNEGAVSIEPLNSNKEETKDVISNVAEPTQDYQLPNLKSKIKSIRNKIEEPEEKQKVHVVPSM